MTTEGELKKRIKRELPINVDTVYGSDYINKANGLHREHIQRILDEAANDFYERLAVMKYNAQEDTLFERIAIASMMEFGVEWLGKPDEDWYTKYYGKKGRGSKEEKE